MKHGKTFFFSLAISPDADIIASIQELKNRLRKDLNRNYVSSNSLAHITLFTFYAGMEEYPLILEEFRRILSGLAPFDLKFFGFASFPPKPLQTFYVKPEDASSKIIINNCATINATFRRSLKRNHLKNWKNKAFKDPHMSIGHELTEAEISKCNDMASEGFCKSFLCKSFVIRRFNVDKRQYDIIDQIPLLDQQYVVGRQLTLF